MKSVHIRSFYGPYFPAFRLNIERYGVFLRIQSKYFKYGPEILQIRTLFTETMLAEKSKLKLKSYNSVTMEISVKILHIALENISSRVT